MNLPGCLKINSVSDEAGVFCFIFFLIGFFGSYTIGLEELFPQSDNASTFGAVVLFFFIVSAASFLFAYAGILADKWNRRNMTISWIRWLLVTLPDEVKRRI